MAKTVAPAVADHHQRRLALLDRTRTSLTGLSLAIGVVIVGVAGRVLHVYRSTHTSEEFGLLLWSQFITTRPNHLLVAAGAVIAALSAVSLAWGRIAKSRSSSHLLSVSSATSHILTLLPILNLALAAVTVGVYFGFDASGSKYTLQSWSCRWQHVRMNEAPHFSSLCRQSRAASGLTAVLVPLEVAILGLAVWQRCVSRQAEQEHRAESADVTAVTTPTERSEKTLDV